jgi:hypothetical protein
MTELIEFKINDDRRKKELSLFLYNVRRSGLYADMIIDRLEAHIIEGKPESVVDSIFHEEPIWIAKKMMQIMIEFGYHYA